MNKHTQTDRYAVMGNPVAHSKSPIIHQAFAKQCQQQISYEKLLIPVTDFEAEVIAFVKSGGKGLNITLPFKQRAYQLADECSERAKLAEAVNTFVFSADRIIGENTDGIGLVRDLMNNQQVVIKQRRVLMLGASGAARGAIGSLLEQQPALIHIANRTVRKAETLAQHFNHPRIVGSGFAELDQPFDIIINATSSSIQGVVPTVPASIIGRDSCCYDMFYADHATVFVQWGKQHGATKSVDGLGMLVEQAAESFYLWRGVRPQTKPVIKMLR